MPPSAPEDLISAICFSEKRSTSRRISSVCSPRSGERFTSEALAESLIGQAAAKALAVKGIGLGVCELVDLQGNITSAHTLAWQGLPVQAVFSELAPAVVESARR